VAAAAALGADAVGFVFHAASPRGVRIEQAGGLLGALPPFVTSVGLFVDADPAFVREVLAHAPLDLLQFHGDEPPEYCAAFGRPWIKAVRMRRGLELEAQASRYGAGMGLLLDTYDPQVAGGTGRSFDWGLIPRALAPRIVLAGGLDPGNVADAVRRVRPWGVDVSGGVEEAKGIKDAARIEAFLQGVRNGDDAQ
jgi:phosphoribosylanthranilate isomerase